MPLTTQHIVETRFSVRLGRDLERHASRQWLDERLELLRRFCLPSIAAQTMQAFTWLVLCDESTDPDAMARLREHERDVEPLRIAMTSGERTARMAVESFVAPNADLLITTQLDSDDLLADAYLEAVQAYAEPFLRSTHRDLLVNFPRGYRLDANAQILYEERMANSSFPSLFERPRHARVETVLRTNHAILRQHHVTHQDESMHGWVIVVHGGNAANRIRPGTPHRSIRQGGVPGFSLV